MRHLAKVLAHLAVIGLALAGTHDSASAKCSQAMGTVLPEALYLVDEVVIDRATFEALDPDDIWSIQVTCREVTPGDSGTRVVQNALVIMTRTGAAAVVEARLRDLVEAQGVHFAAAGSYAATLGDLDFPLNRSLPAIRIRVTEGGWSARSGSAELGTECEVAVGHVEGQPEPAAGVVRCSAVTGS